jgi:hypothetical protein
MDAMERSVFLRTTEHYDPEDRTVYSHRCAKIRNDKGDFSQDATVTMVTLHEHIAP